MPTRVVLRDAEAEQRARTAQVDDFTTRPSLATPFRRPDNANSPQSSSVRRSLSVNFRTAVKQKDDEDAALAAADVSSSDIRASPRLMGYISSALASAVMLVSVAQFYTEDPDQMQFLVFRRQLEQTSQSNGEDDEVERVFGSTVMRDKLIASVAVASAGLFFGLAILWMHLDTIVCPQVWHKVFCDGSIHERNLLLLLIAFWIFGLYVCTSSFSVGEVQANVYFTAWICFASILSSYFTWRVSAGKRTLNDHLKNERETARNWIGTLVCSFVAALSVCDLYANRNNLTFQIGDQTIKVTFKQWVEVMSLVWSCVGACILMLIMIHFWRSPIYWWRIRFDGRFIEGFVLLCLIAVWFWGILEFTQVNGPVNAPSNGYFSIWGAFFFSILTFGTWLKENRGIVQNAVPSRRMGNDDSNEANDGEMESDPTTNAMVSNVTNETVYESAQSHPT